MAKCSAEIPVLPLAIAEYLCISLGDFGIGRARSAYGVHCSPVEYIGSVCRRRAGETSTRKITGVGTP